MPHHMALALFRKDVKTTSASTSFIFFANKLDRILGEFTATKRRERECHESPVRHGGGACRCCHGAPLY